MKWLAAFLFPLLVTTLALACGEEEEEAAVATPSPAPTATDTAPATPTPEATPAPEATPTAGPNVACPSREDLAPYWPPRGTVTTSEHVPRMDLDVPSIPFDQVEVLTIACGDARGRGQDAYVAYQVTLPASFPTEQGAMLTILAALYGGEDALVNLGILPEGIAHFTMDLQDVTGDGKDEIIFDRAGGASWGTISVWSWQEGEFEEVFRGGSYLLEREFRDVNGDGTLELVTGCRLGGLPMRWPVVHRWDGHSFRRALLPEMEEELIAQALDSLESGLPNIEEVTVRTALGHAYERQARTTEAREEYERAWARYEASDDPHPLCSGATDAVQEFYQAMGHPIDDPRGLHRAYSMLGEGLRQKQSFPDFAAQFARTEDVIVMGSPEVSDQQGELARVSVQGVTHELTSSGEAVQGFAATWWVRQEGDYCILESAWLR